MMKINIDLIEDVWNRHAEGYDEKHNALEDPAQWKKVLETLIGEDRNQKVLDLGTGTGFLALFLAELGYDSTGIDLAAKMIDAAKAAAKEKNLPVNFLTGDWEYLPFEDNHYDVLVNRCILWTLFHPENTLREWMRVLKPGGRLLCFCTADLTDSHIAAHHYGEEIGKMLPFNEATPEILRRTIAKSGFVQTKVTNLPGIEDHAAFSGWYVIKGRKDTGDPTLP